MSRFIITHSINLLFYIYLLFFHLHYSFVFYPKESRHMHEESSYIMLCIDLKVKNSVVWVCHFVRKFIYTRKRKKKLFTLLYVIKFKSQTGNCVLRIFFFCFDFPIKCFYLNLVTERCSKTEKFVGCCCVKIGQKILSFFPCLFGGVFNINVKKSVKIK